KLHARHADTGGPAVHCGRARHTKHRRHRGACGLGRHSRRARRRILAGVIGGTVLAASARGAAMWRRAATQGACPMVMAMGGLPVLAFASLTAAALIAACDGPPATAPGGDVQTQAAALTAAD